MPDGLKLPKKPMVRHRQEWYQACILSSTETRVSLGKAQLPPHPLLPPQLDSSADVRVRRIDLHSSSAPLSSELGLHAPPDVQH